jgi:hypothetical protein
MGAIVYDSLPKGTQLVGPFTSMTHESTNQYDKNRDGDGFFFRVFLGFWHNPYANFEVKCEVTRACRPSGIGVEERPWRGQPECRRFSKGQTRYNGRTWPMG